jgi:hypothetical protein
VLRSGAAAAAWGTDGEIEVFAVHDDGQLWNRYWDGTRWHEWEPMGGSFVGQPAACARDADHIDVFAIGRSGVLSHRLWNGLSWSDWAFFEGGPDNAHAVSCAWNGDRLDVFLWAEDGSLLYGDLR